MRKATMVILFVLGGLSQLLTPSASAADNHHAWVRIKPQTVAIGERESGNGPTNIYVAYTPMDGTVTVQTVDAAGKPSYIELNPTLSGPGFLVFGDRLVTASTMDGGANYYVHAPDYVLREAHPSG